jgi:hypothetical protein
MTDVEVIFDSIVSAMKKNINESITKMNNEKGDKLLEKIDQRAWCLGSLDEVVLNFDNFILAYIEDMSSTVNGYAVQTNVVFEIDMVLAQKEDRMDYKRVMRYQKVLQDAAQMLWEKIGRGIDRLEISTLQPIDIKLNDNAEWSKVVGIQLSFTITN